MRRPLSSTSALMQRLTAWRWYDAVSYLLNHATPSQYAHCIPNRAYGTQTRQVLDLYCPKQATARGDILLFVHGGSWQHGKKEDYFFLAQSLAQAGYFVAVMNYRLYPQSNYPDFIEDVCLAVDFLAQPQQQQQYGYHADYLSLIGHSAGAFNIMAALYPAHATSPRIQQKIYAAIGIAGPYDFEHRGDKNAQALPQDLPPEGIMPSKHVRPNAVRHLLLIADNDQLVGEHNTLALQQALQTVGNQVQVKRVAHTGHVSIVATLVLGLARFFSTKRNIIQFLHYTD